MHHSKRLVWDRERADWFGTFLFRLIISALALVLSCLAWGCATLESDPVQSRSPRASGLTCCQAGNRLARWVSNERTEPCSRLGLRAINQHSRASDHPKAPEANRSHRQTAAQQPGCREIFHFHCDARRGCEVPWLALSLPARLGSTRDGLLSVPAQADMSALHLSSPPCAVLCCAALSLSAHPPCRHARFRLKRVAVPCPALGLGQILAHPPSLAAATAILSRMK